MKNQTKYILLLISLSIGFTISSQEKALEVYMRKKPSKKYIIKIDDKVLVRCRLHADNSQRKRLVVARLGAIEGKKYYFYPVNTNYGETIYTSSTLRELGIRTKLLKVALISYYGKKIYDLIKFRNFNLPDNSNQYFFKKINVKSLKWRVKVIEV